MAASRSDGGAGSEYAFGSEGEVHEAGTDEVVSLGIWMQCVRERMGLRIGSPVELEVVKVAEIGVVTAGGSGLCQGVANYS